MNIIPVEYNEIRVLTTQQLADAYETTPKNIQMNFKRNINRFSEGRDYYLLKNDELKEFKNQPTTSGLVDKRASKLILWTERGANRHSKILDTDRAWDQFDVLEETYFRVKHHMIKIPHTTREILMLAIKAHEETAERVDMLEEKMVNLENNMTVTSSQQYMLNKTANETVLNILGGKNSPAYMSKSRKTFSSIWKDYKKNFMVPSYRDTLQSSFDEALEFLEHWQPSIPLQREIEIANNVLPFDFN